MITAEVYSRAGQKQHNIDILINSITSLFLDVTVIMILF